MLATVPDRANMALLEVVTGDTCHDVGGQGPTSRADIPSP